MLWVQRRGAAEGLGAEGEVYAEKSLHLPAGSPCATWGMWLRAVVGICPPPSALSTAGHLFLISKLHDVITAGWMCIFVLFAGAVGRWWGRAG